MAGSTVTDLGWLTEDYIKAKGWIPVCDEVLGVFTEGGTPYGFKLPCRPYTEFREGDVAIRGKNRRGYDVFVVTKEFVEKFKRGDFGFNIEAVVHEP